MEAPGFASPIRAYRQNLSKMRESNDPSDSEVTNLCSLGVVDLDLSLCPDVFGLKAFDEKMPITRMLPGSSPYLNYSSRIITLERTVFMMLWWKPNQVINMAIEACITVRCNSATPTLA